MMILKDILETGFIGLILTLDTIIYGLISSIFKIFMAIAGARLLSSEVYYDIANRLYVVIGVVMLFVLSYLILNMIIDPDSKSKGELTGGGLVKRIMIAIVGLAIAPSLFNMMYQAQGLFLEKDVIARIFFRTDSNETIDVNGTIGSGDSQTSIDTDVNADTYVKSIGGSVTAVTMWQAFFHPSPDSGLTASDIKSDPSEYFVSGTVKGLACAGLIAGSILIGFANPAAWLVAGAAALSCLSAAGDVQNGIEHASEGEITLEEAYTLVSSGESFDIFVIFIDNYTSKGEIDYLWGLSTVAGVFALYAFASFSIDMGVRAAKLAYYQIVAPIPLIMQIIPKFQKNWETYYKGVISTFMEVFIRISVVYVVVFIICHLTDLFSSADALWGNENLNPLELGFALVLLIIGLLLFCKDAPKFITSAIGLDSGKMDLGLKPSDFKKKIQPARTLANTGVGAGDSAVRNALQRYNRIKNNADMSKGRKAWEVARAFGTGMGDVLGGAMHGEKMDTFKAARDAAKKSAAKNMDKNEARDNRFDRAYSTQEVATAKEAVRTAQQALEAAKAANNQQAIAQAQKALEDAKRELSRAKAESLLDTTFEDIGKDLKKSVKRYAYGTVDMSKEQGAIKFASDLNKFKDTLREEAFKKDNATKALKTRYDELMARTVSEYREGWDADSYNDELRKRLESHTAYTTARADYEAAGLARNKIQERLNTAKATGAPQAQIDALTKSLEQANATLSTREDKLTEARKEVSVKLDLEAKRSSDELNAARMQLEVDRKDAKDKFEAAADSYVSLELAKEDSIVRSMAQQFITDKYDYVTKNATYKIDVGNGVKKTVADIISGEFGNSAVTSGLIDSGSVSSGDFMTVVKLDGSKVQFDLVHTTDANGNPVTKYVNKNNTNESYSINDFFEKIISKAKSAEMSSSATRVSKEGKNAQTAIYNSKEYIEKSTMMREMNSDKKGNK